MFIKPTKDALNLWDFNEDIAGEALLDAHPNAEFPPMPWDADIEIKGDKVFIIGSLVPGTTRGKCTIECPIEEFSKLYQVQIPDGSNLEGSGWVEA